LWLHEAQAGLEEARKDRPCAVVLSVEQDDGTYVTVLPITTRPPIDPTSAIALPRATKLRLGLDERPSWIITTEANRFRWIGPDVRPKPGQGVASAKLGLLPGNLFRRMRDAFVHHGKRNRIQRTE
jgi:hypothetical protein